MIKLTDHFELNEFINSGIAKTKGIKNIPDLKQLICLQALCTNILEPLRRKCGPVIISSGFRTKELNELVGGTPTSQHLKGQAADIHCKDKSQAWMFFEELKKMNFDQLIWEQRGEKIWIHVSYVSKNENRRQIFEVIK